MSSNWGKNLSISLFGESHGKAVGVTIDGLPSGIKIDTHNVSDFMARRAPGKNIYSTPRSEADRIDYLSGIYKGVTTGTPLTGVIFNSDTRSEDYTNMPLRPSHGDYTGLMRYLGHNDPRGGGHFSARLTAPLVFAGAIAREALFALNISVNATISSIYSINDIVPNIMELELSLLQKVSAKEFPVFDDEKAVVMKEEIEKARVDRDSLGGIVSCYIHGLPAGVGSPIFQGLENKLASIIFGIPAVRGIEFGTGFGATKLKGSSHNDQYTIDSNDKITTKTNHHGGIIGGISSGMPIYFNTAFKPTPSISRPQDSVDYTRLTNTTLEIKGRHDPCVVPRAVPCVEAAASLAILDALLDGSSPNNYFSLLGKQL